MALKLKESLGKIDSNLLAEYILFRGGDMSNLKLQKLLYYIQAYHLAYFGVPLIDDDFEAWVHGPVSRKIFNILKEHARLYDEISYVQNEGEETPDVILGRQITDDQMEIINNVIDEFGKLSGLELENLTHKEDPWLVARKGFGPADKCDKIIPKDHIQQYFQDQLFSQ